MLPSTVSPTLKQILQTNLQKLPYNTPLLAAEFVTRTKSPKTLPPVSPDAVAVAQTPPSKSAMAVS